MGPGKIALLEAIHRTGSLSQAARDLGMSYRRGWQLLSSLYTSFRVPTVVTATGGRGGGGARVTPFGGELIRSYRAFERDAEVRAVRAFKGTTEKVPRGPRSGHAVPVVRRTARDLSSQGAGAFQTAIQRATGGGDMKLSTRNEFVGTITRLVRGPVSTEVTLQVAKGVEIVSVITTNSAKRLKLKKGQRAHAFIKADHIIVGVD